MLKQFLLMSLLVILPVVWADPSWDDSGDDDGYDDVVTKQSNINSTSGKFEGLFTEVIRESEFKEVKLLFLFSEVPFYGTTYFSYYDTLKQALVLDFYDTYLGNSIMDSLHEEPIQKVVFEELHINLNEGVEGFDPDIRDVVRIYIYTPFQFDFNLEPDEFEVLTLYFAWSKNIRKKLEQKQNPSSFSGWIFWLLGLGVLSGMGVAAYYNMPQ